MKDYLVIGPSPASEPCVQVGEEGYHRKATQECNRYIELIRKTIGKEPEGASLSIKSFDHEYGTYKEVVCYFDPESKDAVDFAYRCESESPTTWDKEEA